MALPFELTEFLRNAIVAMLRSDERDLSLRQLGVFLTYSTLPGPHTVGELARHLNVGSPVITHATSRLEAEELVERKRNLGDHRLTHGIPTPAGRAYLKRLQLLLTDAAAAAEAGARATAQPAAKRSRQTRE